MVNRIENADLVIINSCTVKNKAEAKFFAFIRNTRQKFPKMKIIAAGCVAEAQKDYLKKEDKLKDYSVAGVNNIKDIAHIAEETLSGNIIHLLSGKEEKNSRINIPKIRRNEIIEIVPINSGCLGNCAYCKAKFARGDLFSYDKDAIVDHIANAVKDKNIKEAWLTSQDTGAYGLDTGENLPELLREIIAIPGNFKIRLGMCNPNFMLEYLDKIIGILKNDLKKENRFFKFLHIPVQSGNNDILKAMNRKYNIEDYYEIIDKLKKAIPEITIATDIICGFPGETESQFNESIGLVKKTMPDAVNISRYWARPGTFSAEKMKHLHLDPNIIKSRSEKLKRIFEKNSYENNKKWLGWAGEIIIDEPGKKGTDTYSGRNYCYKPVVVRGKYNIGQMLKVKIKDVSPFDLKAF